jgi:hypothetical protein
MKATDSQKTHELMSNLVTHTYNLQYFRINPEGVGSFGLDVSAVEDLEYMENLTEIYMSKRVRELDQIKELLDLKSNIDII